MKRVRMEVVPAKKATGWKVQYRSQNGTQHCVDSATQSEAIFMARVQIDLLMSHGYTGTLKIKRPNGQVRDERTYPRSSDPRRSKG